MRHNLLDTHTLIWFLNGSDELSSIAKQTIEAEYVTNFVSIASLWEMAVKIGLGKLKLQAPFNEINKQITLNGFEMLPITFEDTLTVSDLPFNHRDPFDRIIIAQAITNDLSIISKDEVFSSYEAKIIW